MDDSKWIASEGGALIAVEQKLQSDWGGICRLTVPAAGASNDYQRIPEKLEYIQVIDLHSGQGLIFGEGPLDTTFWEDPDQKLFIVRTIYCDPDFDADAIMRGLDQTMFENPVERIKFAFASSRVVIFDSADDGSCSGIPYIKEDIPPGHYQITTILYEPNKRASLIIHRFDMLKKQDRSF